MPKVFNFTKASIQKLPAPAKGMICYQDTRERGLSLYITSTGAVTFFVRRRINGRDERVMLGQFPDMTVDMARTAALKTKAAIAGGVNPNLEKKKIRQEITFGELFHRYLEEYSKPQKRSWQYDEREVNKFLSRWLTRKLSSISRQEIIRLHQNIGAENGIYQANRIVERIRAIFNKAIEWGWDGANPAAKISKFKEKTRDRFIQPDELPCFFAALEEEENGVIRDYLWISLLTGARKANVLAMRWDQVNWELKQWRIPETKNGDPLTIPLIGRAIDILDERKRKTNTEWVFPSPDSAAGHLADPKRAWNRLKLNATVQYLRLKPSLSALVKDAEKQVPKEHFTLSGFYRALQSRAKERGVTLPVGLMDVHIHDIRRTLGSYQAINGASLQVIGKSLGHKSHAATQIYSRMHLDPVRDAVEKATETMWGLAQPRQRQA